MNWKNIGEQIAHFALLGAMPAYFSIELAIAVLCVREFSQIKLPWPFKGQWPPGDPYKLLVLDRGVQSVTQMDRVEDLRLDVIVTLAGMAAGHALSRVWWVVR